MGTRCAPTPPPPLATLPVPGGKGGSESLELELLERTQASKNKCWGFMEATLLVLT